MQRSASRRAVLAITAILAAGSAAGAPTPHDVRLGVAGGESNRNEIRPLRLTLATAWTPAAIGGSWLREYLRWDALVWELNATRWAARGDGARDPAWSIGLRANLRYALDESGRSFLETGIGPMWLEEPRLRNDLTLGGELFFDSHIGIGRALGAAHELSVSVHHASNADLEPINPGIDFLLVEYGYLF